MWRKINYELAVWCLTIFVILVQIQPSASIVGGTLAYCKDHPYFAHLVYESDGKVFCGGAIIHPNFILTASHCLLEDDFKVYVGVTKEEDFKLAEGYKVRKKIPYPSFRNGRSWFDIGLVQLSKQIKFSANVDMIDLATSLPKIGQRVAVVGFGNTGCQIIESGIIECAEATHLKSAKLKIIDIPLKRTIKAVGKHQNICHGDSGSPMIYNGQIIGVSATVDVVTCRGGGGTFAPVFTNLHWIKKHLKSIW